MKMETHVHDLTALNIKNLQRLLRQLNAGEQVVGDRGC